MQSPALNAATIQKVLSSPAVRSVVLKQLDAEIGNAEKNLAQLRSTREQVAGSEAPAKPSKKASAAAAKPTRRKAKKGKKSSAAAAAPKPKKRGPGRPKGSKNRKSGHTKAILTALAAYDNGVATAKEIRDTCAENGHEMESGIFHSTMTALIKQERVTKTGERAEAVYTLVEQEDDSSDAASDDSGDEASDE